MKQDQLVQTHSPGSQGLSGKSPERCWNRTSPRDVLLSTLPATTRADSLFKAYLTPLSSLFMQHGLLACRISSSSSDPCCLKSHLLWTHLLPASSGAFGFALLQAILCCETAPSSSALLFIALGLIFNNYPSFCKTKPIKVTARVTLRHLWLPHVLITVLVLTSLPGRCPRDDSCPHQQRPLVNTSGVILNDLGRLVFPMPCFLPAWRRILNVSCCPKSMCPTQAGHSPIPVSHPAGMPAEWCERGSPCCHGFPASPLALIS